MIILSFKWMGKTAMTVFLSRGRSWHFSLIALCGVLLMLSAGSRWDVDHWRYSVMTAMLLTLGLLYIPGFRGLTLLTGAVAVTGAAMIAIQI